MANRFFEQFQAVIDKGIVNLFAVVNVGAAGAVTLQKWNPGTRTYTAAPTTGVGNYSQGDRGIKSVVRNSTGNWTFTLQDSYQRYIVASPSFASSGGLPAAPVMSVVTGSGTNVNSNTAPTINVLFQNTSGVATDPASGEQVTINFTMQNSSAL